MDRHFFRSMFLSALLPATALFAQDGQTHNLKLAFELGANVMSCELVKPEQIRENHYSRYYYRDKYDYDYGYVRDYSDLRTFHFGVKPEIFVFNNRIGIASGLRFTYAKSELVSNRNDFLWKLREEGLNTYYVQIKDIQQNNYLLGIPFEVRYFQNRRELPVQHYFKFGASFNFRIHQNTEVSFTKENMKKYNDEVQNQLPNADNFFSAFIFGAVGFKIGRYKEGKMVPWGNIDFQFPYFLITENSFAFAGTYGFGVGFQCSLQIPIGNNVPIGSK